MFPFMHINLALNSHFNPMDSSWENKKKVENGGVFEGRTLTCKIEPIPSLKTSIYCLNTIFFMVHLCNSLFFSVMSSSSNSSKVGFFKKRPGNHLQPPLQNNLFQSYQMMQPNALVHSSLQLPASCVHLPQQQSCFKHIIRV